MAVFAAYKAKKLFDRKAGGATRRAGNIIIL